MDHEVIFKVKVTELGITRYDRKEWNVISKTGDYVNIGDPLVDVIFIRERSRDFVEVGRYTITSDRDGYFVDSQLAYSWDKEYSCYIFPTLEDLLEVHDKVYEITHDPYTSEIGIKWNSAYECGSKYLDRIQIDLSLFNGKPCLKFEYNKNRLNLKIRKNDSFIFLFDDNSTLCLKPVSPPYKTGVIGEYNPTHGVKLTLSEKDIEIFKNKKWKSFKIEFSNGNPPYIEYNKNDNYGKYHAEYPLSGIIFQKYVEKYIQGLDESGVEWRNSSIREPSQISEHTTDNSFEGVYVYLMIDTTNGFHKIGISNNPEYRERTLQSEKPSIEMICSKRYPTREIARAIESSLHSVYSTKHIRGEWFKLDDIDVIHLIETLK